MVFYYLFLRFVWRDFVTYHKRGKLKTLKNVRKGVKSSLLLALHILRMGEFLPFQLKIREHVAKTASKKFRFILCLGNFFVLFHHKRN